VVDGALKAGDQVVIGAAQSDAAAGQRSGTMRMRLF
jgi:hypothetical protein